MAASLTKTGTIAALGGSSTIPPVVSYLRGYQNGALSVNPDIKVNLQYVSDDLTKAFNDPAGGTAFADQFMQQVPDADIIFTAAGKTGNGMLQAICAAKAGGKDVWGIGVDVDQYLSTPDAAPCLLTSAEKKLTNAVSQLIVAVANGTDVGGNVFFDASNEGIGLAPFYEAASLITPEIQAAIDAATAGLADGSIDPCAPNACDALIEHPTRARVRQDGPTSGSARPHIHPMAAQPPTPPDADPALPAAPLAPVDHVPALEMRGITKRYPGRRRQRPHRPRDPPRRDPRPAGRERRRQVDADEHPLRARAPGRGEILLDGQPVTIADPTDAIARGINMVHQHFMLVPVLTVAENILLGEETMARAGFLDRKEASRRIRELGERFGFEIDPDEKVGRLSVGWQQRVEILKALYRNARILVLDEPTAVLTPQETEEIFAVLRRLAAEGHSIVFISHKLYEVLEIADRITVIRRGRVVGQRLPAETNEDDLAELMVGREVQLTVDRGESHPGEVALKVQDLVVKNDRGSGRRGGRLVRRPRAARSSASRASPATARTSWWRRSPACASPPRASITLGPDDITQAGPARAAPGGRGVRARRPPSLRARALVPAHRQRGAQRLLRARPTPSGWVRDDAAIRRRAEEVDRSATTCARRRWTCTPARSRAATSRRWSWRARWTATCGCWCSTSRRAAWTSARVEFIHRQTIAKRDTGTAVLLVSAELDEVLELSDRIGVMYRGRIVAVLDGPIGEQGGGRPADGDRRRRPRGCPGRGPLHRGGRRDHPEGRAT